MKIRQYFIVYLDKGVIILPLRECLVHILTRILDKLHEWELLNKPLSGREKYFRFFVDLEVDNIINETSTLLKSYHLPVFFVRDFDIEEFVIPGHIKSLLVESNDALKTILSAFKCKSKYSYKETPLLDFSIEDYSFKTLKVGKLTGETEEILSRFPKKFKNSSLTSKKTH